MAMVRSVLGRTRTSRSSGRRLLAGRLADRRRGARRASTSTRCFRVAAESARGWRYGHRRGERRRAASVRAAAATGRSAPARAASDARSSARSIARMPVGRGRLAEAEVDHDRAVVVHEDVRGPQGAMGEAHVVQELHLPPDRVEQLVGQLRPRPPRRARRPSTRSMARTTDSSGSAVMAATRGEADAAPPGQHHEERLVGDVVAQVLRRPRVRTRPRSSAAR